MKRTEAVIAEHRGGTSEKKLFIRRPSHKGPFIKDCPCSPGAVSCGYSNANLQTGCLYRCSYCILQEYLDTLEPVFFRNWLSLDRELASLAATTPHLRLGTGELSDSLVFEDLAPRAQKTIDLFQRHHRIVFEFKTKSTRIKALLSRKKAEPNIVVSWSLNPAAIIRGEETGTPPLQERLRAMAAIQAKGYRIGIHFDPLIMFSGWRDRYKELVDAIAYILDPDRLAWWSLGALRFSPALKPHLFVRKRTILFSGELVPGFDGKYRYFKPLRIELFCIIKRMIEYRFGNELPLYLCMEDKETWGEVFPGILPDTGKINRRLYEAVFR